MGVRGLRAFAQRVASELSESVTLDPSLGEHVQVRPDQGLKYQQEHTISRGLESDKLDIGDWRDALPGVPRPGTRNCFGREMGVKRWRTCHLPLRVPFQGVYEGRDVEKEANGALPGEGYAR